MTAPTPRKLAGPGPRWAPFAGFSVIFDPPRTSVDPPRRGARLATPPAAGGPLDLHHRLHAGVREILGSGDPPPFWPLPAETYHVTAWDGVNRGNLPAVPARWRAELQAFLEALPASLLDVLPEALGVVTGSALVTAPPTPIALRYASLAITGDLGLVARLASDSASDAAFGALVAARRSLSESAGARFGAGVVAPGPYRPHVSLGYFASDADAEAARAQLGDWDRALSEEADGSVVVLATLGVYAFSDMVSFYRL